MTDFERINRIIKRNPAKFSGRAKIDYKWLQKTFDWLVPGLDTADPAVTSDAVKFVRAYTTINKVIAERGIYMKACNYYTHYQICNTRPTVDRVVAQYFDDSIAKKDKGLTLRQGYNKHAGVWSPLTSHELSSLRR